MDRGERGHWSEKWLVICEDSAWQVRKKQVRQNHALTYQCAYFIHVSSLMSYNNPRDRWQSRSSFAWLLYRKLVGLSKFIPPTTILSLNWGPARSTTITLTASPSINYSLLTNIWNDIGYFLGHYYDFNNQKPDVALNWYAFCVGSVKGPILSSPVCPKVLFLAPYYFWYTSMTSPTKLAVVQSVSLLMIASCTAASKPNKIPPFCNMTLIL